MKRTEVSIHHQGSPLEGISDVLANRESVIEILVYRYFNLNGIHLILDVLEDVKSERPLLDLELHNVLGFPAGLECRLLPGQVSNLLPEVVYILGVQVNLVLEIGLLDLQIPALLLKTLLVF